MPDETVVTVYIDRPAGASDADVVAYFQSALAAECGCMHPSEPMSHLDRDSIVVLPPKRGRRKRRKS